MIKNDRHFSIVRSRFERLRRLQDELLDKLNSGEDPLRTDIELRAVRAEVRRMEAELNDYSDLKDGRIEPGNPASLEELPQALIRARIAGGLTHAQLAARLGLKEQQVQRYEASDYESASLSRLIEVAQALRVPLGTVEAVPSRVPSRVGVLRHLKAVGMSGDFLDRRFTAPSRDDDLEVIGLIGRVAHVYGWTPEQVIEGPPPFEQAAHANAYKKPRRASGTKTHLLAGYSRFLTRCVRNATPPSPVRLPSDPIEFAAAVDGLGDGRMFGSTLRIVWECGIPVVPLSEPGGFHAGCWTEDARPVVVLNSVDRSEGRWTFDLLHEVGHIINGDAYDIVEGEMNERPIDEIERTVNEWASAVLLRGRAEELFERAWVAAREQLPLMQRAVAMIARQEGVNVDVLALHVAFRLSERGKNWWPAAMNMQHRDGDPWGTARDLLVNQLDWSLLRPVDADLLARALDLLPPDRSDRG